MSMPAAIRLWPARGFLSAQKPSLPMSVRPMPAQLTENTHPFHRNCSAGIFFAHNGHCRGKELPLGRLSRSARPILAIPSVICWINWIQLV